MGVSYLKLLMHGGGGIISILEPGCLALDVRLVSLIVVQKSNQRPHIFDNDKQKFLGCPGSNLVISHKNTRLSKKHLAPPGAEAIDAR